MYQLSHGIKYNMTNFMSFSYILQLISGFLQPFGRMITAKCQKQVKYLLMLHEAIVINMQEYMRDGM